MILISCQPEIDQETMVYSNDFESGDLTNIVGGSFIEFNNSQVIGNFNNDGFELTLENIPNHDFIVVKFDLYTHDSWDGNTNEVGPLDDDHDAWIMEFDPWRSRNADEKVYFETTFSNGECNPARCLDQSFPNTFPFVNNARTQAVRGPLPGLCFFANNAFGSSHYRFERFFPHDRNSLVISFRDRLLQTNVPDPKCDESWSMDNLTITALTVN